jgi:acyl-ACP thioesterase
MFYVSKTLLWNIDIDRKCKITIIVLYLKIILCVAGMWMCTEREESKLQAVEIKLLRAVTRKTRRDRIRIRGNLKMEEVQNKSKKVARRWFGHVRRIYEHRIPKILLEMKMNGRCPRRRPHI